MVTSHLAEWFYTISWVRQSLLSQFRNRYVTVRFPYGLRRHYSEWEQRQLQSYKLELWRREENPFFEIHDHGDNNNPTHLDFFIKRGAVEWIPEVSTVFDLDRSDTVIVDLDPKDPTYTFDQLKGATRVVHTALCSPGSPLVTECKVRAWKFRFSGNRSFHIYIKLDRPYEFPPVREIVKKSLKVVTDMYPQLSYQNRRSGNDNFILIDIGALARHRCVRSLWSLHYKTALACVPVTDVESFQREQASPEVIVRQGEQTEVF